MDISQTNDESSFRLKLDGPMIFDRRQMLEETVGDAMRCATKLEADLSAVREIDLYGVHLLGLLRSVGAVIDLSPAVEEAAKRLLASCHGTTLGRAARNQAVNVC